MRCSLPASAVALLLASALLPPAPLAAEFATITGKVTDRETGDPVATALVAFTDLERTAVTDHEGRYSLTGIEAGPQHVVVQRIGYRPSAFHALVPRSGTLEINVGLRPSAIRAPEVEVSVLPMPGLEAGDSTHYPHKSMTLAAIRNHPLLHEPDVLEALGGGDVVVQPEAPEGLHVHGGSSDHVAYVLDGIPILSPYRSAGTFSTWNPDALSRLRLYTGAVHPELPDVLSGVVAAESSTPGDRLRVRGSFSTTQGRLTVDGPVGDAGAGYLLGLRSAFPGLLAHSTESSYLDGDGSDLLAKLAFPPLRAGHFELVAYDAGSEVNAARKSTDVVAASGAAAPRNDFHWHSRSVGAGWKGSVSHLQLRARIWRADGDADAAWARPDSASGLLRARREDVGFVLVGGRAGYETGFRLEERRTSYRFQSASDSIPAVDLDARTPIATGFVQYLHSFGGAGEVNLALSVSHVANEWHPGPAVQYRWEPSEHLALSVAGARHHQFEQSLRNPESVVGTIFPADLHLGAQHAAVPVARSDIGILAIEHRPTAGVRIAMQAFARDFDGLVLVALHAEDPFATHDFPTGTGHAYGGALEIAANSARYGVMASYGIQELRLTYADTTYVPAYGIAQSFDAGLIVFPSPTLSVRLGMLSAFGRRVTAIMGPFEWEAWNLLDRGSEFAGGAVPVGALGGVHLPAYVRFDLGFRKHWHLAAGGRDATVTLFGTVTNLLGRSNVLTYAVDPDTGARTAVEMRPLAPLVVGLDWRF